MHRSEIGQGKNNSYNVKPTNFVCQQVIQVFIYEHKKENVLVCCYLLKCSLLVFFLLSSCCFPDVNDTFYVALLLFQGLFNNYLTL